MTAPLRVLLLLAALAGCSPPPCHVLGGLDAVYRNPRCYGAP